MTLSIVGQGGITVEFLLDDPEAIAHIREQGRVNHIPGCCVDEFVADLFERHILPAETRPAACNEWGVYVPCSACVTAQEGMT